MPGVSVDEMPPPPSAIDARAMGAASVDEHELRQWIRRVKDGTVTRRDFTRMMVGAGLTAPMAAQMLASSGTGGVAQAQQKPAFTPTKRGGGGSVKTLWWQGPVLLNP